MPMPVFSFVFEHSEHRRFGGVVGIMSFCLKTSLLLLFGSLENDLKSKELLLVDVGKF